MSALLLMYIEIVIFLKGAAAINLVHFRIIFPDVGHIVAAETKFIDKCELSAVRSYKTPTFDLSFGP